MTRYDFGVFVGSGLMLLLTIILEVFGYGWWQLLLVVSASFGMSLAGNRLAGILFDR